MRGFSQRMSSVFSFRKKDRPVVPPRPRGPPPNKPDKPSFLRGTSTRGPEVDGSGMVDWSTPDPVTEYESQADTSGYDAQVDWGVSQEHDGAVKGKSEPPQSYQRHAPAIDAGLELELGAGCYLDYDPRSGGVLYALWSQKQVDGPRAYFRPGKPVPAFKYNHNHGRNDLIKGLGVDKKKYYAGWLQFFRMARDFEGSFVFLDFPGREIDIWCFSEDGLVYKLECFNAYSLSRVEAMVVMPRHNSVYEGIGQVSKGYFLSMSRNEGQSIDFQR